MRRQMGPSQARRALRRRKQSRSLLGCERLEPRALLSVSPGALTDLNARPVLDVTASPKLQQFFMGNLAPPTGGSLQGSTPVSALVQTGGLLDNFSDPDGNAAGIAITGTNLQGGRLWYSIDAAATWREMSNVADTFATLLYADAGTHLYYQPAVDFSGSLTDVITFRAWDRTGGFTNGTTGINTQIADPIVGGYDTSGVAYGVTRSSDGRYAYVADSFAGLQIIDVQNPAGPMRLGGFDTSGVAYGVTVSFDGRYAYVADETAGLQIIDVQNPAAPTRLGGFDTSGDARDVMLSSDGRYAYVADSTSGLQIIDVQNPAAPTRLGGFDTSGDARGVTLSSDGRYAYVADYFAGLQIIDVQNPAAPARLGGFDTRGAAVGVTLSSDGRYAYVADSFAGLQIIDVQNPAAPIWLGGFGTSGGAYGSAGARGVTLSSDGRYAYVADYDAGLQIIDVQNPAAPTRLGGIQGSEPFIIGSGLALGVTLSVDGRYAYVAEGDIGLQIIDVQNPAGPTRLGGFDTSGEARDVRLSSDGRYAYVADSFAGLQIIDVQNPAGPMRLGGFDTSGVFALGVTLSSDGRYAYVADYDAGLQIIDVQNPDAPTRLGGFDTSEVALGVKLSADGRYAYVADSGSGLQIIDVQNPAAPIRLGGFDTSGSAYGVTLSSDGRYAYVADFDAGLQIIDVQNPAAPTRLGGFDTSGAAMGVTLSSDGRYAYVADYFAGLQIIDVQNPAAPARLGGFDTRGAAVGATLSSDGRYAYVASYNAGLQIIDVRNLTAPVWLGGLDTSRDAYGITLSSDGRYAYVAHGSRGLEIIDATIDAIIGRLPFSLQSDVVAITVTNVNETPTDITLSAASIAENKSVGTVIGSLTTTDTNVGDTFTYTLVSGVGSTDNASFAIVGNQLQAAASFDFETKSSYTIRVRSMDQGGLFTEKAFTITVTNVNETPTITSSAAVSVAENQTAVQTVTATDPDAGTTLTYGIVGGADQALFAINAGTGVLSFKSTPNYESPTDVGANSVFDVTVQVSDGTLTATKAVAVTVTNVNEGPTDITITGAAVAENLPAGTVVGTFLTTDVDAGNSFTYTLVSGTGSTDNASYAIVGNQLQAAASFDFETKSSYTIRVRSTDQGGLFAEKVFTITITDLREPTVSIFAASADQAEGTGGSTRPFLFTVTRSGDLAVTTSISWAVTGSGTRLANAADFAGAVLPSGVVLFTAGQATKTITVPVAADLTIEGDEGLTITLSKPTLATLGSSAAAAGIIRNDDLPFVVMGDAAIAEGDSGAKVVPVVVSLSAPAFAPVTVAYATFDRTATLAGSDYLAAAGTLTFAPGETLKTIALSVRGDTNVEPDESFGVRITTASGAKIAKADGLITIVNDDVPQISVAATDADKKEGNTGRTAFTFTVTRLGSVAGDLAVSWSGAGNGASPADRFDFIGGVLPTGTVLFGPGKRTATITVNVLADRVVESNEQFKVTVGGALSVVSATGTIVDDDRVVPRGTTTAGQAISPQAFAWAAFAGDSPETGTKKTVKTLR